MGGKMTAAKPTPLVSKLRFAEFRDAGDWMTKILENQGGFLSSLTGKTAKDFDTGDAAFIPYMNVFSNTFTNILDLRSVNVGSDESQNAVAKGDVFFTISSETPEEAGMSSVLLEEIENCYLNSFCALFRFDDGKLPNPVFLGYLLRSTLARAHLSRGSQGATRYNIPKATFRSLPLQLPSGPEQQKIADCLGSLDDLVEADGRKLEALRQHKQGLMQQLFPQPGETVTRLRFPEFSEEGAWEETTIGNMGEVITGSTPSTSRRDFYGGDFMFVSPADISDLRFVEETKTTLTEAGFVECRPIKKNSVLFVCIGSTIGKVAQCSRPCATNQQINSLVASPAFVADFAYYLLDRESVRIARLAGKQAVPIINKSLFATVKVTAPVFAEQQRIADCLSSLDARLAAQVQKINALKQHKRGLLQQLFPKPETE